MPILAPILSASSAQTDFDDRLSARERAFLSALEGCGGYDVR
jgi:hypothetical protein